MNFITCIALVNLFIVYINAEDKNATIKFNWRGNHIQENEEKNRCTLPNRVGDHPEEVCEIVSLLMDISKSNHNIKDDQSLRYVFFGKPGTGKTTAASHIAEITNSGFKIIDSSSLVDKYAGTASQKIISVFTEAIKQSKEEDRPVIIFFDEIDKIARHSDSENRSEHEMAVATLWQQLDQIENNPRIAFIGATNNVSTLHPTFKDRIGEDFVEFNLPKKETRAELIKHFTTKHQLFFSDQDIAHLVDISEGLGQRNIKNIIEKIIRKKMIANTEVTANLIYIAFKKKIEDIKNTEAAIQKAGKPQETWSDTFKYYGEKAFWIGLTVGINWASGGTAKGPTPPNPS